jgi:probable HAF family extracellular repeat protein
MLRRKPSLQVSFFALGYSLAFGAPLLAEPYSVVEIPAPLVHAAALNLRGDVVGDAGPGTALHFSGAFMYRHGSREVTELPCQGTGCSAYAVGIDEAGDVIGTNYAQETRLTAIIWIATGGATVFSNTFFSTGSGLNNHGQAVLTTTEFPHGQQMGLVSDLLDQSLLDLIPLLQCGVGFCDAESAGNAINDRGHAVGWSFWGARPPPPSDPGAGQERSGIHAALWINGQPTDLGALGDKTYSSANGVNDFDEVVGSSTLGPASHAFLYRNGEMRDLGNLAGDPSLNSEADGINDRGEIVGWSDVRVAHDSSIAQRAFVARGDRMSNLTLLIGRHSPLRGKVVLTEAVAINCDGWIAANGYDVATRAVHAYLLTPREAHRRECSLPHRLHRE